MADKQNSRTHLSVQITLRMNKKSTTISKSPTNYRCASVLVAQSILGAAKNRHSYPKKNEVDIGYNVQATVPKQ